jgi:hypothetical protein
MRGLAVGFRLVNQGIMEHEPFTLSTDGCRRKTVFLKMGIITFPHDSQAGGNGALADGENRPGQQGLRIFPNGLGKKRLKLCNEWQQLDRQFLHIEDVFWRKILLQLTRPVVLSSIINKFHHRWIKSR